VNEDVVELLSTAVAMCGSLEDETGKRSETIKSILRRAKDKLTGFEGEMKLRDREEAAHRLFKLYNHLGDRAQDIRPLIIVGPCIFYWLLSNGYTEEQISRQLLFGKAD